MFFCKQGVKFGYNKGRTAYEACSKNLNFQTISKFISKRGKTVGPSGVLLLASSPRPVLLLCNNLNCMSRKVHWKSRLWLKIDARLDRIEIFHFSLRTGAVWEYNDYLHNPMKPKWTLWRNTLVLDVTVWAGIAQSLQLHASGFTVWGSNHGGGEIFCTVPHRPWGPPSLYIMGTGSFPEVKRPGRGVDHPPESSTEVEEGVDLYVY